MTVNFGGFKNSGAVLSHPLEEVSHLEIWTLLDNKNGRHYDKYKKLLQHYPSQDGFVKIKISDATVPIQDSFIRINGKKMKFDDLTKDQTKDIGLVRKMLNDMNNYSKKFEVDNDYYDSDKPLINMGIDLNYTQDKHTKRAIDHEKLHVHSDGHIRSYADVIKVIIENKLLETFSKW